METNGNNDWGDLLGAELQDIVTRMRAAGVAEMVLEQGTTRLRIQRGNPVPSVAFESGESVTETPSPPGIMTTQPEKQGRGTLSLPPAPRLPHIEEAILPQNQHVITAPLVGRFFRTPEPDKPAYIQEGQQLRAGQVIGIIEAMKMYNEIQSDVAGTVLQILVDSGQPVEYGQPLILIERAE